MSTAERIYEEVKTLPEDVAREVLDFVEFMKVKRAREQPAESLDEAARTLSANDLAAIVEELRVLVGSQPMTSGATVRKMRDEARY